MSTPTIMTMTRPARMASDAGPTGDELTAGGLHALLAWMSPSFPVGAYTYSHGLERVIEDGAVCDAATLHGWLDGVLRHGAGRSDAVLLAHAMSAATPGDERTFRELLELSLALQPSSERRLEASAQGDAFASAVAAAWTPPVDTPAGQLFARLTSGADAVPRGGWTYCMALAASAAAWGLPAGTVVSAGLHAFAANLVSAAVRAVPLGQTDGQRVLSRLGTTIRIVAGEALVAPLSDIGGCAFATDIASMNHEVQYTRLFRS